MKNYHRTISTKNPHTTINKFFAVNSRFTKKKTHAHRLKQPPFSSKLDHHSQRFTIRLSRTLSPIEKTLSPSRRKKDRQEITRNLKEKYSRRTNPQQNPFHRDSHLQVSRREGFSHGAKKKNGGEGEEVRDEEVFTGK